MPGRKACGPPLLPGELPPGHSVFGGALPLHAAHTPDDDELAALVCCVENLRNGVTTIVEAGTVAHPQRVAAAMLTTGIRGTIGTWGWDVPEGPYAAPADEVLDRLRDLLERFPSGGMVEGWVTLVGHGLASDELFARAAELARSAGTGMTLHMSPGSADVDHYLERSGRRPLE